jgi:superfamily II DNA helicase RecQ
VYCRTRSDAETLSQALRGLCYHAGSGLAAEKEEVLRRWVAGTGAVRVLAATSAFVEGVDYPHVRSVFHVGAPDGCLAFAQAVGRGGRDGGKCASYVLLPDIWRARTRDTSGELLSGDTAAMCRYLDYPCCRLAILSEYLDGEARTCSDPAVACDRCYAIGLLDTSDQGRDRGIA